MKQRIWELDALRGIAILGVIIIHLLFDLQFFLNIDLLQNPIVNFVKNYGGVIFILLSGLCATLGSRSLRRGLIVFAAGMLITAVTVGMVWLNMANDGVIIRFGVLHLLGICMILWPLFRKLPWWALAAVGAVMVALGYWFVGMEVEAGWLFPLGLTNAAFSSADYFPLFPHLGWFLIGGALGKTLYRNKQTLLPKFPSKFFLIRFFCWCGRQSLWIYLLHQPVLYGIVMLLA